MSLQLIKELRLKDGLSCEKRYSDESEFYISEF